MGSVEEENNRKEQDKVLKEKQEKMELRKGNLEAWNRREELSKSLDSSLKKNTAFIKKLRGLTEEQKESLCNEASTLNLSRYISEVVTAISEAKLKPTDVGAAVKISSFIHQRYADFTPLLISTLTKFFSSPSPNESEAEKNSRMIRKRILFRFLGELLMVGILKDSEVLLHILKDLIQSDILLLSSNQKDKESSFPNLALVVSFVRSSATEIFGLKKSNSRPIQKSKSLSPSSDTSKSPTQEEEEGEEEVEEEGERILSLGQQKEFYNQVEKYFKAAITHLVVEHKELKAKERENTSVMESRGELSETMIQQYDKAKKSFEKLLGNTTQLAELLSLEKLLPPLLEDQNVTRIESSSISISFGDRSANVKDNLSDSPFDDEDTRSFYENIPDLRSLGLPGILFGDSDAKDSKSEDQKTLEDSEKKEKSESEPVSEDPSKEKTEKNEKNEKNDKGEKEDAEANSSAPNSTLEAILFKLPNCVNRDLIDEAAKEFCYINSKLNRKKMVKAIFSVPRTQLALLPYYARMIAVLTKCMKDVGPSLLSMLEDEFYWLYKGKDQINIETKIKNIRFLGELVKFKICPANTILSFFKLCLDDFVHHNIDVACNLCETCGRFLFKSPETHLRTKNLLEIMMRLKNAQNLPHRLDTMVENAYYQCIPPERQAAKHPISNLTPLQLYLCKLIYQDLNKNTTKPIMKQLRKVSWTPQNEEFILDCLLSLHKGKYNNVHLVASLIAGLSNYHEIVSIKIVDRLLELIRFYMELNDFKMQQRQIILIKFLGELYNYCVIEHHLIFNSLFLVLSFGLPSDSTLYPASLPLPPSNPNTLEGNQVENPLDSPTECFRIRLVCTLLETCGQYFDRGSPKKKLDRFLLYFQRYILLKKNIPMDVEFAISDTLEQLRPASKRFTALEAVNEAIAKLEAEEREAETQNQTLQQTSTTSSSLASKGQGEEQGEKKQEEQMSETSSSSEGEDEDEEELDEGEEEREEEDEEEEHNQMEEEEKVSVRFPVKAATVAEDEEFDREFAKMMQESVQSRKFEGTNSARMELNMSIPMNLLRTTSIVNSNRGRSDDNEGDEDASKGVQFKLLMKKGNKQTTKSLNIPVDCSLAANTLTKHNIQREEQQEMKRLVLEYGEREEQDDSFDSFQDSPSSGKPFGRGSSTRGKPQPRKILHYGGIQRNIKQ